LTWRISFITVLDIVRKKNQHIAAVALSTAVALPVLIMLLLQGWQLYLKHHAGQRLREEIVQTIKLPVQQVQWEKKEKEIVVHGRMFDIQTYDIQDGWFIATGVFDEQETSLLQFFHHHTRPEKAPLSLIQLLLLTQGFIAFVSWLLINRLKASLQKLYSFYFIHYCSPFAAIISPPPRFHL
jgi:hypothetical protein